MFEGQRTLLKRLTSRKFLLAASYMVYTILAQHLGWDIDSTLYWSAVVVVGVFIGVEGLIDMKALKEKALEKIGDIWE